MPSPVTTAETAPQRARWSRWFVVASLAPVALVIGVAILVQTGWSMRLSEPISVSRVSDHGYSFHADPMELTPELEALLHERWQPVFTTVAILPPYTVIQGEGYTIIVMRNHAVLMFEDTWYGWDTYRLDHDLPLP